MVELKTGDIVFCKSKTSKISAILAWFMQSKWSHTFIILERAPKRTYEVETTDFEVAVSCWDNKYLNKEEYLQIVKEDPGRTVAGPKRVDAILAGLFCQLF